MKRRLRTAIALGLAMALLGGSGTSVSAQPVASIALPAPGSTQQLYPGCNNISLTFPDGTPSQTVVQAVTPAGTVETLWRFNGPLNRFEGFSPAFPQASDLMSVNFLDAVWFCMAKGLATQPPPAQVQPPPVVVIPPAPICAGPPTVASFTATPNTIDAGKTSTLSWGAATNVDTLTIDQGIGQMAAPGTVDVKPATTTTYTLTATGCGGTTTYQVTVTVNVPGPNANLEPTDFWIQTSDPNHPVWLVITNQYSENRSDFTIGVSCTMERYPKGQVNKVPPDATQTNDQGQISISVGWGEATMVPTGFSNFDLANSDYDLRCTITPIDFTDPFWNSYEKIFS
jgi:hypothetical protein